MNQRRHHRSDGPEGTHRHAEETHRALQLDPGLPGTPMLTFLGATRTVTGSRFCIETPDSRVLVDCGLYQGLKELRLRNWDPFPFPAHSIDAVVLTHAHVDHCGFLPALVREGFRGVVWATPGTAALAGIVLPDAGHLQEEEAAFANRIGYSKHRPALPLYTEADARRSLTMIREVPHGTDFEAAPGVGVRFGRAGHILGSSTARVTVAGDRVITFSGDLGRPHHPLLQPPEPIGDTDFVVIESTYGDRHHDDTAALELFARTMAETLERGGVVVIPAFAVDRTEIILWHLRRLMESGRVPTAPVYADSPMALRSLRIYRQALAQHWPEMKTDIDTHGDPFDTGDLNEVFDVEGSKGIDHLDGPAVIVSASGMATGGRILHHLATYLPKPQCTVMLAGFQAPGTRGRRLVEGARELKLLGRYVPVRAQIVSAEAFSVHADGDELLDWLGTASRSPEMAFVVHGEPDPAETVRSRIEQLPGWAAVVPRFGERVRLD